jgi:hypothetical protein
MKSSSRPNATTEPAARAPGARRRGPSDGGALTSASIARERRPAPFSSYWITTSSGKRNVVAPSSNCTRNMRRSRLLTSRSMRGCSLNRLRPSWSRTGFCSLQCLPISSSVFKLVIIFLPLRFRSGIPATITHADILASFGPDIYTSREHFCYVCPELWKTSQIQDFPFRMRTAVIGDRPLEHPFAVGVMPEYNRLFAKFAS